MAPNLKMLGVTLGLVFISNTVLDSANPTHAMGVRVLYVLSQLFCYGTFAYMYFKAKNNTEPGVIIVKEDLGFGQEGDKEEKITVAEYDMRQTTKEAQRFAIGSVITIFLHLKWGFFPPLVIQTVTQPFNVFQSPLAKVSLLGHRAWGELRRPWKDANAIGPQWNAWNDTIATALGGEPTVRQSKKAAKKLTKRKGK
ncbi:TPA: hypothetical protein N0F65_009641 [Lagenidium giganteum]|uniref:Uncharacterized protein n=1 Tax=Lagenidium giganteum TaxID=4803 RepID=A0AAV2YIB4_9STRA|nr:TPA: hypothetical protein N0F65_009641 [Lagenidium giganteum]